MLLDAFMGFLAIVAVVQFVYCVLAGKDVSVMHRSDWCYHGCGRFGLTMIYLI